MACRIKPRRVPYLREKGLPEEVLPTIAGAAFVGGGTVRRPLHGSVLAPQESLVAPSLVDAPCALPGDAAAPDPVGRAAFASARTSARRLRVPADGIMATRPATATSHQRSDDEWRSDRTRATAPGLRHREEPLPPPCALHAGPDTSDAGGSFHETSPPQLPRCSLRRVHARLLPPRLRRNQPAVATGRRELAAQRIERRGAGVRARDERNERRRGVPESARRYRAGAHPVDRPPGQRLDLRSRRRRLRAVGLG